MKYVGDIITNSIRPDTRNEDYNTTTGIKQDDILRYVNYAQERLQSLILATCPGTFQEDELISIVSGQEAYSIPDRVFAGERIVSIEYSPTGQVRDYYKLRERGISYRNTNTSSDPAFYIRRSDGFLLNPIPTKSSSSVRVTFERQLDTLSFRLATAGSVSGATLNFSAEDTSFVYNLSNARYVCVSDKDGNVMLYNGLISTYNAGVSLVLAANVSTYLATGYTTGDLAGGYLTFGKYSTTHSKLKDICERYLEVYPQVKMFSRDASETRNASADELNTIEKDILATYQMPIKDDLDIQISDGVLLINNDRGLW